MWSIETIKEASFIFLFHHPEYTSPEGSCPHSCKLVASYNRGYTFPYSHRQDEVKLLSPKLQTKIFPLHGASFGHMPVSELVIFSRKML